MKGNRTRNIFFKIVESAIWAILGSAMTISALSSLETTNKIIVMLAIALIMLIMFLLFLMNSENDNSTREGKVRQNTNTAVRQTGNSTAPASRGAQPDRSSKSDARISRSLNRGTNPLDQKPMSLQKKEQREKEQKSVKTLVLINEEGDALMEWNLAGKTALIIGKNTDKEKVDIDLECSAYASLISKQHAVLNYTDGGWYIDDIDSRNGTRVKKLYQNSFLDVKLVGTVEVEPGDIIYIANTMLQLK